MAGICGDSDKIVCEKARAAESGRSYLMGRVKWENGRSALMRLSKKVKPPAAEGRCILANATCLFRNKDDYRCSSLTIFSPMRNYP